MYNTYMHGRIIITCYLDSRNLVCIGATLGYILLSITNGESYMMRAFVVRRGFPLFQRSFRYDDVAFEKKQKTIGM